MDEELMNDHHITVCQKENEGGIFTPTKCIFVREKTQKHLGSNAQHREIYETQKLKKGKYVKLFNFLSLETKY